MSHKSKMLLAIVSIIAGAVGAFSAVAYYQLTEGALHKEMHLIATLTAEEAEWIGKLLPAERDDAFYKELLQTSKGGEQFVDLLYGHGERVAVSRSLSAFFGNDGYEPLLDRVVQGGAESGHFDLAGQEYIWARSQIGAREMSLLSIYQRKDSTLLAQKRLFYRLLVIGALIIWISAWVVLWLASRIGRELDAQGRRLEYQANYDELTSLPNRSNFSYRLATAIDDAGRTQRNISLFIIDINRFKDINDTLGHQVGDKVLRKIAARLRGALRVTDIIGRIGGDEFGIVIPAGEVGDTSLVANKLLKSLDTPLAIDDQLLKVEISIGIAIYPEHGTDSETLLRHAEVAMYRAKETVSVYDYFELANDPAAQNKLEMISDLHIAIATNQLRLDFQPKFELGSNRLYGAEALLRWEHFDKGMIPPAEFIPMAEHTYLITPLTLWVLDNAIAECARWRRAGKELMVAVNLSARNIHDVELPERIYDLLRKHALEPSALVLEITETAIVADPERAGVILGQFKRMGIALSLDDFGTGYTSLSHLKNLPLDEIKIDQYFVRNMCEDNKDRMIVKTIIDLSHNMGFRVVAEGIESGAIMDELIRYRCDSGQGYHLGKPLSGSSFIAMVEAQA